MTFFHSPVDPKIPSRVGNWKKQAFGEPPRDRQDASVPPHRQVFLAVEFPQAVYTRPYIAFQLTLNPRSPYNDCMHFDIINLIKTTGYIGVFSIIFAESGLLIGFFLPGDSLLFTAGFLASQGFLDIKILSIGCFIASYSGVLGGYWIGQKFGRRLFQKENSLLFHKGHLEKAKTFYEKHGGKAIILTRFIPIIRTFAPVAAGIGDMNFTHFQIYNIVGSFFWSIGLTIAGYELGKLIPNVDRYLLPIIILIILASVLPSMLHYLKDSNNRTTLKTIFFQKIKKN